MSADSSNSKRSRSAVELQSGASLDPDEIDASDYCSWWVLPDGYTSKTSGFVHIPDAVRDGEGNNLDDEPDAETLCYTDNREGSQWQTKSHAVFPPGYRATCSKCKKTLVREVLSNDDE